MAGRVTFAEENVRSFGSDFPKLKLQQVGEYGRILAIEDNPLAAYIHTLRKPRIVNGRPQTTLIEKKDGTKVEDYLKDFVGQPICLGDEGILADRGSDPAHCPACAEAARGDMVELPKRRFAMHVIKYLTRPGSADIQLPFQVQCVVWAYTENVFNKLVSIKKETADQTLLTHDLILGPLQAPATFQKFDIAVSARAEWLLEDSMVDRRALVAATFKQNQCSDLESMIGRKVQARWMEEDIQSVRDAWQIVHGFGNQPRSDLTSGADLSSLTQGLDGLLNGGGSASAPAAAPATDPWAALAGGPAAPVAPPAFVPPPAAVPDLAALAAQLPAAAAPAPAVPPVTNPSLDALAALSAAPAAAPQPAVQPTTTAPDLGGLAEFVQQAAVQQPTASAAQPAEQPAEQPPTAAPGSVATFDDLLKGIVPGA